MTVNKVVTQTGTWIATIILARILSPTDYGMVGMVGLLVGIITLVGDFGLSVSLIQKKDITKEEISALFWQYLGIGTILASLIYILAPVAVRFWNEPELHKLMQLSAIPFFINSLCEIPTGLMKRKMKFKQFGFLSSIAALSGSVVSIYFALHGAGALSLIYGTIGISIVKCILVYIFEPWHPKFIFVTRESWSHLKFGATVTLERYLWWIYANSDSWLASKFLGKNLFGIYAMAIYMASAPIEKLLSVINPVALPAFARIEDRQELIDFYYELIKKTASLTFPLFIFLFWVADDLITLLFGQKWTPVIPIFQVMVIISTIRLLAGFNSPLLNAIGRPDVGVRNMFIGLVMAITAFSIGVQYDLQGLVVAWLSFYPLFYLICLYKVSKVVGFSLKRYFDKIYKPALFCLIVSLAIFGLKLILSHGIVYDPKLQYASLYNMLVLTVVFLTAYVGLIYYFDRELYVWCLGFLKQRKKTTI